MDFPFSIILYVFLNISTKKIKDMHLKCLYEIPHFLSFFKNFLT